MPNYDARYSDIQRVDVVAGTGLIGTMNTLAIGGGNIVSISNSAGWLIGVGSTSIVNSAGWVVSIANTTARVNAVLFIDGDSASAANPVPIMPPQVGYLVVSMGSTSIVNSAGWVVSMANTGGAYTLSSGTGLIGSANIFGTISVANTGGAYTLSSGTGVIGTASLLSTNVLIGSMRTLQYAPESTQLVGGSAVVGTAYTILLPSSSSLNAGTASIGTAAVILINTANWTVSNRQDVMSMASNNVTVYSYTTGIECSATNNLIISASANRIFKVLGYSLMSQVANNALFQSGSNLTELKTGTMFFGGSGGIVMPYNPMGWFNVTAGSPLYLKLATANSVGGVISYVVM